MFTALFTFALLASFGYFLKEKNLLDKKVCFFLKFLVLNFSWPALAFIKVYDLFLDRSFFNLIFALWLYIAVSLLLGFSIGYKLSDSFRGSFMLTTTFANMAFIGYPLIEMVWGSKALGVAIIGTEIGMNLMLFILGYFLAAKLGQKETQKATGKKFPKPLIAVLLALPLNLFQVPLPLFVRHLLEIFAQSMSLLVLIYIGSLLEIGNIKKMNKKALAGGILLKMLVFPFFALGIMLFPGWGLSSLAIATMTLEIAMPTISMSVVLAEEFGLAVDFAAQMVFLTTIISVFTLPIWKLFLEIILF